MKTTKFTPFFTTEVYSDVQVENLINTCVSLGLASDNHDFFDTVIDSFLAKGRASYEEFVAVNLNQKVYALPAKNDDPENFKKSVITLWVYASIEQKLFEFINKDCIQFYNDYSEAEFGYKDYKSALLFLNNAKDWNKRYQIKLSSRHDFVAGPHDVWSYLNPQNELLLQDTIKYQTDYRRLIDSDSAFEAYYSAKHPGKYVSRDTYDLAYSENNRRYFSKKSNRSLGLSFLLMAIIAVYAILPTFLSSLSAMIDYPWVLYVLAFLSLPLFLNVEWPGKLMANLLFMIIYGVGIYTELITIDNIALLLIGAYFAYYLHIYMLGYYPLIIPSILFVLIGAIGIYIGFTQVNFPLVVLGALISGSFLLNSRGFSLSKRAPFIVQMSLLVIATLVFSIAYLTFRLPFIFNNSLAILIGLSSFIGYIITSIMYTQRFQLPLEIGLLPHLITILSLVGIFVFVAMRNGVIVL